MRLRHATVAAAISVAASGSYLTLRSPSFSANDRGGATAFEEIRRKISDPSAVVPPRAAQVSTLAGSSATNPLDMLVIGGGATGSGVALDAVSRGLRVGLVEREDFASGTSSRSTKLIHGGIIYIYIYVFNCLFMCVYSNYVRSFKLGEILCTYMSICMHYFMNI